MPRKKLDRPQWTIVQHSAFGYVRNPQFKQGLESRAVNTVAELNRIMNAGGLLMATYNEAEDYCMKEMYPEGVAGFTPKAPGTFSRHKVDGLAIYIPAAAVCYKCRLPLGDQQWTGGLCGSCAPLEEEAIR